MELKPAKSVQVGAIGKPGRRVFFLRASGPGGELALKCEKFQVEALASRLDELLSGIASELARPRRTDYERILEEIGESEAPESLDWAIAELGIGYDPQEDLVLLVARSVSTEEEGSPLETEFDLEEGAGDEARIWITRAQAEALAYQCAVVAAAGRRSCPFCTMPIDPEEGHDCFSRNGHKRARLAPGGR